jgi:hypothetical protein
MRQNSFSARLASKMNSLYRKIFDRRIELAGILTDVIRVKVEKTAQLDIASREITGMDLINIIYPRMENLPMRKITRPSDGTTRNAIYAKEREPFMLVAPITVNVDVDDILIKLYEDVTADHEPWVTVLQVKDILGTFGDRSIIYQKIQATYLDEALPPAVITYVTNMATRRETGELGW